MPVSDHPFVFQLTPSRRATWTKYRLFQLHPFQLTPSRRATAFRSHQKPRNGHFNSRPHGGRLSTVKRSDTTGIFQLTPSRRATDGHVALYDGNGKISTHALTEGDNYPRALTLPTAISTHALTEGDLSRLPYGWHPVDFNSRPHGGRQQI